MDIKGTDVDGMTNAVDRWNGKFLPHIKVNGRGTQPSQGSSSQIF